MEPRVLTGCLVDLGQSRVIRHGKSIELAPREVAVLEVLFARPHQTVSRETLVRSVWGDSEAGRALDFTIRRVRQKIEMDPGSPLHILTVRGVGYRFEPLHDEPEDTEPVLTSERSIRLHDRVLDLQQSCVIAPSGRIELTPIEVGLLTYLDQRRGLVVPRRELLQNVWGYAAGTQTGTLSTTLHRLRVKLEEDPGHPRHLVSVRGAGVRFEPGSAPAPLALDRFIGRTEEMAALTDAFVKGRWVTLVGMGGLGKTRLAQEFVSQLTAVDNVPVRWVSLGSAAHEGAMLAAVRHALSVPGAPALRPDQLAGRIGRALTRLGAGWLVLDCAERLVEGLGRWVPQWLSTATALRVLVTSREAIRSPGERQLVIRPMTTEDGAALLAERMRHAGVVADVSHERRVELVTALEGIPLAIELAASRIRTTGIEGLLLQLPRRLDALHEASRPPRMSALRAVIDGSWEALSPEERQALTECTVFGGPFSGQVAAQVLTGTDPLLALASLVDKSLLTTTVDEQGRVVFALLDTVRLFATERRTDDGPVRLRHLQAYVRRVEEWRSDLGIANHASVLRAFRAEITNVWAAHQYALDEGLPEASTLLVDVMELMRGEPVAELLERLRATVARQPGPAAAALQLGVAECLARLEDAQALDAFSEAVDHAKGAEDATTGARAHLGLAAWHRLDENADEAAQHLEQAAATAAHDRVSAARVHLEQAVLASLTQDDDLAWPRYAAAEMAFRRLDQAAWLATTRGLRGRFRVRSGDLDAGHADLLESLRFAQGVGDLEATAERHRDLAERSLALADLEGAWEHAEASVAQFEAVGRPRSAAVSQLHLVRICFERNEVPRGVGLAQDALDVLSRAPGGGSNVAAAHALLGQAHHLSGRLDAAHVAYERGRSAAPGRIGRRARSIVDVFAGLAWHQQGREAEAQAAWEAARHGLVRSVDLDLLRALAPGDRPLATSHEVRTLTRLLTLTIR